MCVQKIVIPESFAPWFDAEATTLLGGITTSSTQQRGVKS
jgi:hypothetical protein